MQPLLLNTTVSPRYQSCCVLLQHTGCPSLYCCHCSCPSPCQHQSPPTPPARLRLSSTYRLPQPLLLTLLTTTPQPPASTTVSTCHCRSPLDATHRLPQPLQMTLQGWIAQPFIHGNLPQYTARVFDCCRRVDTYTTPTLPHGPLPCLTSTDDSVGIKGLSTRSNFFSLMPRSPCCIQASH